MSAGTSEEWVYVDLGAQCTFDRVTLSWIRRERARAQSRFQMMLLNGRTFSRCQQEHHSARTFTYSKRHMPGMFAYG